MLVVKFRNKNERKDQTSRQQNSQCPLTWVLPSAPRSLCRGS